MSPPKAKSAPKKGVASKSSLKKASIKIDYKANAQLWDHAAIVTVWGEIKDPKQKKVLTNKWSPGMAFECLIARAFELEGAAVEYSYKIPPTGKTIEQIDGFVELDNLKIIIECKDYSDKVDMEPVYKLHCQLSRRPDNAIGCFFSSNSFTETVATLLEYLSPKRIFLWVEADIENAILNKNFRSILSKKIKYLYMHGISDYVASFREAKV